MSIPESSQAMLFDVRGIAKPLRHAAIFGALESMGRGQVMRFVNDHDPIPLLKQIEQRYGEQVRLAYVQRDEQCVVIDFSVYPGGFTEADATPASAPAQKSGGCGGGGGGCGCSGH